MLIKTIMEKICTGCLMVLLISIIAIGVKRAWMYHSGPMNTIHNYIQAIDNGRYDEAYNLLDKSTLNTKWDKELVIKYYQNHYELSLGKEKVQARGWKDEKSYLITSNIDGMIENTELVVQKINGRWKIKFPFNTYNLEINAPLGSKVYVNTEEVKYMDGIGYIEMGLLDGDYEVKVEFDNEIIDDYEKKIKLCNNTRINIPYDTGNMEVKTLDCMKVKIKSKYSESEYTDTSLHNMLVGDYSIKLYHPNNYISEINKKIKVVEGNNKVEPRGYELSNEGEEKYQEFITEYYRDYAKAINEKSDEAIYGYFKPESRDDELKKFREWYVDNKEIISSTVSYNIGDISLNDNGCISANIMETVELLNKENNDEKNYKVVIEWIVEVNINEEEWKISNRTIKQSIVAIKDSNSEWVEI